MRFKWGNLFPMHDPQLTEAVTRLSHTIRECTLLLLHELSASKPRDCLATKHDLEQLGEQIMSGISAFLAQQKEFNDRQAASLDKIGTSVDGITGDVKTLNDKITELQNSSGQVSPEDQALIDALQTQGQAIADKVEAASTALSALDDLTPPSVPAVPPTA